jgi:putative ATPase
MKDQMGLFEGDSNSSTPLAFKSRPKTLELFYGQEGIKKRLKSVNYNHLPHIIFYGPPGSGKTTLSTILAEEANLNIYNFNAVLAGVNELRGLIKDALSLKKTNGKLSVIFIDEIHRFNKAQQDALLPYLEAGDFVLFGATTEYPQTSLNKAILSRVQVWPFEKLDNNSLKDILQSSLKIEKKKVSSQIIDHLALYANGDARSALNSLELILNTENYETLSFDTIKTEVLNQKRDYDKNSDRHYDVISAFIKSVRGSDIDAAILWLAIMLDGGEDPDFIARRLIILASEDIGNADPRGLQMATSCHYAIKTIGMPEARIILAQTTTYLASAPKSNSSYLAIDKALDFVKNAPTIEVPTHLRNKHPDKKNYKYPHSYNNHWINQPYKDEDHAFFKTSGIAYERMQKEYLDKIKRDH